MKPRDYDAELRQAEIAVTLIICARKLMAKYAGPTILHNPDHGIPRIARCVIAGEISYEAAISYTYSAAIRMRADPDDEVVFLEKCLAGHEAERLRISSAVRKACSPLFEQRASGDKIKQSVANINKYAVLSEQETIKIVRSEYQIWTDQRLTSNSITKPQPRQSPFPSTISVRA